MPPPDSLYIMLPDSTVVTVPDLSQPAQSSSEWDEMIFWALVVLGIWLIGMRGYWRHIYQGRKAKKMYETRQKVYDAILDHYIPYYRNLSVPLKDRFLKRTLVFLSSKTFEFVEMVEEEHMSLLISAAAVQLTFGLRHYLMDHFTTIYIIKSDYRYGLYNVPFQGHVNEDGIYLSWNNFLRAYTNDSDGDNVGLHEMAHALAYVNFTAEDGVDEGFKERFSQFSRTGREVFRSMEAGEITLLGAYAATNYQEFWAVCVENFFERPHSFRIQLPELYEAMCKLLNQDLLRPELLLFPVAENEGR